MYGSVNWLNALDELTKMKKGTDLITLLFIFKSGVVILAQERVRGKKGKPKVGVCFKSFVIIRMFPISSKHHRKASSHSHQIQVKLPRGTKQAFQWINYK
jgi:hypothetical protein